MAMLGVAGGGGGDSKPPATEKKPPNSTIFVPLETADELRARLKKMYPGLTDEEVDHFM
jgi:hypothetical protein